MDRITLYKYDKRYRNEMLTAIENRNSKLTTSILTSGKNGKKILNIQNTGADTIYFDLTPLFHKSEHIIYTIELIDEIFNIVQDVEEVQLLFIIEQRYADELFDSLYHKIKAVEDILTILDIENTQKSQSIVEINEEEFEKLFSVLQDELFGNDEFKKRLHEELMKYRFFNCTGLHPIFSVLILGNSGIGKTEVARIFHRTLSPDEPMIKINFGNYSSRDALNSLIGSPRGYIGSETGELTSKLQHSQSKVILIDEFEKADKQVHNFFLQLLEEGKFTDSLGNEFNLNQYVIFFTSNASQKEVDNFFSPELMSRFNYKVHFTLLSTEEKNRYVQFKITQVIQKLETIYPSIIGEIDSKTLVEIDVKKYNNLREINNEIMKQISNNLYAKMLSMK